MRESDLLLDGLTNDIFDEGVKLSFEPKFEELIANKIVMRKTQIIKILFEIKSLMKNIKNLTKFI